MNTRKFRILTFIVAVIIVAIFVAPVGANNSSTTPETSDSHAWGNYHWARTSNPFHVKLGDNVTSAWDSYLVDANADWNASSVLNTSIVAGQSNKRCRPTAGRGEVCNGSYGQNGWLGLAQIWLSGGHISQGTAKMNDTYFNMAAYNTPAERRHVMCQEVGHIFGLGHQDESGASLKTCMDYAQDSTYSQHPNAHDYQMLESIYNSHLDSSNTSYLMPRDIARVNMSNRSEWGQLVASNHHADTYVRDFGNGHMVYTFVYAAR